MEKLYLETDRLRLREMAPDEGKIFFDIDSDPEVMKYLNGGQPSTMEDSLKGAERVHAYYDKYNHQFGLWIAEEKASDDCIGWFILRPDKNNPEDLINPELGYRFKRKFWGKGYATEGSVALLKKAFSDLACKTVFAVTMKDNVASQNVMKKIGMSFVKSYQHEECFGPGNDPTAVYYSIAKEDWLKKVK